MSVVDGLCKFWRVLFACGGHVMVDRAFSFAVTTLGIVLVLGSYASHSWCLDGGLLGEQDDLYFPIGPG